ncbi:6745_t:CDS:2 [Cetraspora pellucida]|uniref:6745_t:CDS:1 n=1 Tax=Cetraspora pellucida TaxID=1433469 RepID=A0ACA9LRU9_9GLOM|nr:6745_t:CDS:2 [Cetraspora pellucida]
MHLNIFRNHTINIIDNRTSDKFYKSKIGGKHEAFIKNLPFVLKEPIYVKESTMDSANNNDFDPSDNDQEKDSNDDEILASTSTSFSNLNRVKKEKEKEES